MYIIFFIWKQFSHPCRDAGKFQLVVASLSFASQLRVVKVWRGWVNQYCSSMRKRDDDFVIRQGWVQWITECLLTLNKLDKNWVVVYKLSEDKEEVKLSHKAAASWRKNINCVFVVKCSRGEKLGVVTQTGKSAVLQIVSCEHGHILSNATHVIIIYNTFFDNIKIEYNIKLIYIVCS